MNCRQFQDHLIDYLYGELPTEQADAMRAHGENCPSCGQALRELSGIIGLVDALPDPEPMDALTTRVLAHARDEAEKRRRGGIRWWVPVFSALCIMVVVGGLTLQHTMSHKADTQVAASSIPQPGAETARPGAVPEPEVVAEAKPAPAAEEPKPATQPMIVAEAKPAPAVEEAKPATQPMVVAEAKPAPEPMAVAEAKPAPAAEETKPAPEPMAVAEAKPASAVPAKAEKETTPLPSPSESKPRLDRLASLAPAPPKNKALVDNRQDSGAGVGADAGDRNTIAAWRPGRHEMDPHATGKKPAPPDPSHPSGLTWVLDSAAYQAPGAPAPPAASPSTPRSETDKQVFDRVQSMMGKRVANLAVSNIVEGRKALAAHECDQAFRLFENALIVLPKSHPERPAALLGEACAYACRGENEKALKAYRELIKEYPDHKDLAGKQFESFR